MNIRPNSGLKAIGCQPCEPAKDGDTMWVKLVAKPPVMEVIRPTDLQASITVSR